MRRSRFLQRGESMVASTGLMLAAILLAGMGSTAWWVSYTYRDSFRRVQQSEIGSVGELLAETSTSLLEAGEMTALRRVLADASRKYNLEVCRVVFPDGRVVADINTNNIDVLTLPEYWEGQVAPKSSTPIPEKSLVETGYVLNIPERGELRLEIISPEQLVPHGYWDLLAGGGLVGAISLIALLIVYRRMRNKFSTLGAIREALLAYEQGMTNESALQLSADYGLEAIAWNQLLKQRQILNKQLIEEKAGEMLGARRETHSDLDGACDALKQGLILIDDQNRTRYINGAAAVLLQTTREDCLGKSIAEYITDPKVLQMLEAVANGEVRRWTSREVELDEDGGHTGVIRFSARPVRQEDSAAAMIIIEDLTQQRVAEEARKSFVAHATHELRTPLTNIRLYVETVLEDGEHDPALRSKCLNIINEESRRLERIVGDMLSVSEIEAGSIQLRPSDVRLDALFEQLEIDYQAMAREHEIALSFELPPKLPVIQGDRDKIVLAMHNLLGNAMKYTPAGGTVRVRVDSQDSKLVFEVMDSGIGIDSHEIDQIFDKFYRASNSRQGDVDGSGLGLTLAREVVRLHGGDITVESELNSGSTFTLTLPVLAQAA